MAIELEDRETRDHVVLVWTSDRRGDVLPNTTGVRVEHVTRVVSGSVEVKVRGSDRTAILEAGQEVVLPAKTPYAFRAVGNFTEIHCFYPKADAEAVEDVSYLRERRKRVVSGGEAKFEDFGRSVRPAKTGTGRRRRR